MGSLSEDEENGFFDAQEDIASISDANSDTFDSNSRFDYDVWIRSPRSVKERRSNFLKWTGLDSNQDLMDSCMEIEVVRVREDNSGAVLRSSGFESEFYSSRSLVSCGSYGSYNFLDGSGSRESFVCRDGNFCGGMECCHEEEVGRCEKKSEGREAGLGRLVSPAESESASGSSPFSQKLRETSFLEGTMKGVKSRWLNKLRSMTCIGDRQGADGLRPNDFDAIIRSRAQRIRVRQSGKRSKELSALYMGQDIQAHEGSILTMKFSPDGQYLASAGEDGVVRLWQVVEDERSNELHIPELDPSCLYFTVNHMSEVKPLFVDKEKMGKATSLKKTSDSACVIFPPKVFRILEKPLHEFHGHSGEILDLSWSKNNHLLSSSVDKTVRLWRVGCDDCLQVFSHSNYVTCVQFNPVDDDYFISGSIDGKVRIWGIPHCQVVDWTDIREIVTAVCYRPDGQGGIVGSITGSCHFYNISDNRLQLDAQICLHNKKKSPCRKITGFQFSPQDSSIVMVTCADSQVRVLHGLNVIGKYRGLRNAGNQISASFTSDGKHIVSACEDSNVYLWSCFGEEETVLSQSKKVRSCERFSTNASVAIPWSGLQCGNSENGSQFHIVDKCISDTLPFSSLECFSISQEFFLESFPKASATWPEEKLPISSPQAKQSTMHRSQLKFLKSSCKNTPTSHAWGMVIVTAGWDGRIRSFHNYGLPIHR
ncbi:WD repeat-containing protein 44 [Morus notabilis]|uniref:WD repeat-containing protein 44 n=1 Tax=Morus notabilis TaxID=981085 RepID=W9SQY1_9ROSA|nr:WD repeat-containing protein 44 [Morus notabilis]XP_024029771.1 WD repeat-containing protein 44 [Morus notabilis]EXC21412.1 WD repeat-containing protein 44 [Morus notabilis]